jgi:hypothetical protein
MVALLLEYKPDLTIADDFGMSPLKLCSIEEELAEFLQEHGVPPDSDPTWRLIRALETKGIKHVEREIATNPALARSPGMGELAAMVLHHSGTRLIKLLLENGLDANCKVNGMPLLQSAIFGDRREIVQALLEHGADPTGKTIGGQTSAGQPYVIETWKFGLKNRKAICDLLIQYGARKDLTVDLYLEGVKSVIAQIERDPQVLETVVDPVDLLNHSVEKGTVDLVELLLRHGLDPNAHGPGRPAPLRLAVRHGKFETMKALLEHGANPNPKDADTVEQDQPLCYEAEYRALNFKGGPKFQDLLLAKGMEPMPGT